MLELFCSLFGSYEPIQSVVSGSVEGGDIVYSYCIDWSYVFNLILVCIVVYGIFKLISILLGGSRR